MTSLGFKYYSVLNTEKLFCLYIYIKKLVKYVRLLKWLPQVNAFIVRCFRREYKRFHTHDGILAVLLKTNLKMYCLEQNGSHGCY